MQETEKAGYSKPVATFVAGLSILSIYILACVSSPVAWSPDSSKIALLVTPPGNDFKMSAIFVYDVITGEHILLDKVDEEGGALSAPSWSPDSEWIAYYKVDPPLDESNMTDPCNITSMAAHNSNRSDGLTAGTADDPNEMTSEDSKNHAVLKVKLMTITPDGTEQRVVQVVDWSNDSDVLEDLMLSRPVWTPDSKTIFYVRRLSKEPVHEICSLDLVNGKIQTHVCSSINTPSVSPDGNWIVSFNEDKNSIILVDPGGNKDGQLEIPIEDDEQLIRDVGVLWSPDSKNIFVRTETAFRAIDFMGQEEQEYYDPEADEILCPTFCSEDNRLYYLAVYEVGDPNQQVNVIDLKCINLEDGQIETMFNLYDLPEIDDGFSFSISPNGEMVSLRCVIDTEIGSDKSAFVLWDGQNRKIIETDSWLIEPMYTDKDLILEDKIIGEWIGDDGVVLDLLPMEEEITYDVIAVDKDGKESQYFAHLVKLEDMMFLAIFHDKSLLQQKDSQGSYTVADIFLKVDQIEPKLLLQELDYEEVFEILKDDSRSLEQETEKADYVFKGVRTQQ